MSIVVCRATSEGLQIGKHWCWIVQETNKIPIEVFITATLLPIPEACNKAGAQECGTNYPDATLTMLAKLAEDVNSSKSILQSPVQVFSTATFFLFLKPVTACAQDPKKDKRHAALWEQGSEVPCGDQGAGTAKLVVPQEPQDTAATGSEKPQDPLNTITQASDQDKSSEKPQQAMDGRQDEQSPIDEDTVMEESLGSTDALNMTTHEGRDQAQPMEVTVPREAEGQDSQAREGVLACAKESGASDLMGDTKPQDTSATGSEKPHPKDIPASGSDKPEPQDIPATGSEKLQHPLNTSTKGSEQDLRPGDGEGTPRQEGDNKEDGEPNLAMNAKTRSAVQLALRRPTSFKLKDPSNVKFQENVAVPLS